ncbi:hypothetical protein NNC19_12695 [Clostridium sp. SHJSY1]|uniref:hypothetical protein n=1 Tax=Clostridium sp. SHJSY1 TaxID=2942483 RepID=UPI002873FB69|nr:hypothetical protein [Clostridium sp. SHJSY1]MDS0526542.1 hypothetical protein [Clostridium sp. SHJSY1]
MTTTRSNEGYTYFLQKHINENRENSKEIQDYDIEQIKVEDKIIYEKLKLSDIGIEFNSEEFHIWKEGNKKLFFPALDAPWEVRRAWREHQENVAREKADSKKNFRSLEDQMCLNISKMNGLFFGIRLKDLSDYSYLINLAISTYNEIYNRTKNSIFKEYVNLLSI